MWGTTLRPSETNAIQRSTHSENPRLAPVTQRPGILPAFCLTNRTEPDGVGSPGMTEPTSTLLIREDTTPAHQLGRTRIGSTWLKTGSPKGRVALRSSAWQSRPFMPGPLPELPVIECMRGRSGLRRPRPGWWRRPGGGPVYRSTTPTMLARVNGVPDDQIGLAQADCCLFAARGGRFVGGRSRTGPLTCGGAEGI
jgi:hypothetical protein